MKTKYMLFLLGLFIFMGVFNIHAEVLINLNYSNFTTTNTTLNGSNIQLTYQQTTFSNPTQSGIKIQQGYTTRERWCFEFSGYGLLSYISNVGVSQGGNNRYYNGAWNTAPGPDDIVTSLVCGTYNYSNTGNITQTNNYTLLSNYNLLYLNYNQTLNGKTITPYLNINGIDYNLTNNYLAGNFLNGTNVKIKYYFAGNNTTTPILNNNIVLEAFNLQINTPLNGTYYNNNSILINITNSLNTNLSYSLNGASNISLCSSCNSSSNITLSGLSEGVNNITIYSNYSGTITSSSSSFTIDTTNPTISNNIVSQYFNYTNNNLNSSCSDTNLLSCNISMNSQNKNLSLAFNFTTNGNQSYNITAIDLAGNTATATGVTLVNPYQRFYFNNAGLLSNFTFGGINWTGTEANFTTYNDILSLGNNTFNFSKQGYATQSFTFNINTSSNINTTYNVSPAYITLYIRDKITGAIINGTNFSVDFISSVGLSTSTTTGIVNITNSFFQNEDYIVTITNPLYATESLFFEFDNQENLVLSVYMINATATNYGVVYIQLNNNLGVGQSGANVYAQQWDTNTSSYIAVSSGLTAENGKAPVNIILDSKWYIFLACYNSVCINSTAQTIPTVENGKTIILSLSSTTQTYKYQLEDFIFTAEESFNNVTNVSTITYFYNNLDGYSREVCIKLFRQINNYDSEINGSDCETGVTNTMINNYLVDSAFTINIKVGIMINGTFVALKNFPHQPTGNFKETFTNLGLIKVVLPFLFIISIGLGLLTKNIYIGVVLLLISSGLSLLLLPTTIINGTIVAFLFFIGIVTIWGAS